MKRLLVVLAVIGLTVTLTAAATTRSRSAAVVTTTAYVETTEVALTDADESGGPSPGDIQTFTLTEYNREGGQQTGKGHGSCILAAEPFSICQAVVRDRRGNLVLTWQDNADKESAPLAVTGGTRKYRNVRGAGSATVVNGDVTKYTVKVRLIGVIP